jgi:hypothetical protein
MELYVLVWKAANYWIHISLQIKFHFLVTNKEIGSEVW